MAITHLSLGESRDFALVFCETMKFVAIEKRAQLWRASTGTHTVCDMQISYLLAYRFDYEAGDWTGTRHELQESRKPHTRHYHDC